MKSFLALLLFALCLPLAGQTPTYDELEFEPDSLTIPYKPAGKNYVFIRSKRGTSGVNKTATADAVLSSEITDIVLVFSELDRSAIADRDEANRERWENLLKTYPEFFQFSTTYKNLCQCNSRGDSAAFKKAQGFYIYVNGEVPKVDEPVAAETKPVVAKAPETKKTEKTETKAPEPAAEKKNTAEKKAAEKEVIAQKEALAKDVAVPDHTAVKTQEPPPVVEKTTEEKSEPAAEVVKKSPAKKGGVIKSRKAKDPRACRPACYGNGQEDLDAFFKDNLKLSKKQRRSAKKQVIVVKLQLNVDGSVKKALVTCPDEKMNVLVTEAIKSMNPWNATIKAGVTVKSEVKLTLKYDKGSKSMKAFEVSVTPRQPLKCKCASDSEMFGSD